PGNQDGDGPGPGGGDAGRREERFIAAAGGTGAALLPAGGCPGPAVVDVGKVVRLVALDTQWWLHNGTKPEDPTSSCPADSDREVIDSLHAALASGVGRAVVVLGHHPLATGRPARAFSPTRIAPPRSTARASRSARAGSCASNSWGTAAPA